MRLLIDLQVCQGAAKNRGMGRYSLSLAKAMITEAGLHEVIIAVSTAFPRELVELQQEFRDLLPVDSFVAISLPPGTTPGNNQPWLRESAARWYRQQLLDLQLDAIHIPSVFSGHNDDVTVPLPKVGDDVLWSATLHDLIPLIRPDEFLTNKGYSDWYNEQLDNLCQADLLLANSEASRKDAIRYLGLSADSVRTVGAAIEPDFSLPETSAEDSVRILSNLRIYGSFVFYLGGCSPHKNFEGLIKAHSLLPECLRERFKLVLAGEIDDNSAKFLRLRQHAVGLKSKDVVLLGKLSDAELSVLYANCFAFIFPSYYEGFGLPILEAMACGAPVICSNTSSMVEVVGDDSAMFDPADPLSISRKLREVLENDSFRQNLIQRGKQHAGTFRWQTVAKKAWAALEEARGKKIRKSFATTSRTNIKVVVVATKSVVIESTQLLISHLFPEANDTPDIGWVFEDETMLIEGHSNHKIRSVKWLADHFCDLDYIYYWIDENTNEFWIKQLMERFPGIVVILKFFAGNHISTSLSKNLELEETAWQNHGYNVHVRHSHNNLLNPTALYPCNFWLFENAIAVISPYPWLENETKRWYGDQLPPFKIFPPIAPVLDASRRLFRREMWNVEAEKIVFLVWLEDPTSLTQGRTLVEESWRKASLSGNAAVRLEFFNGSALLLDGDGWIEGCDVLIAISATRRSGEPRAVIQAMELGKRVISNTDSPRCPSRASYGLLTQTSFDLTSQELSETFTLFLKESPKVAITPLNSDFSRLLTQERTKAAKFAFSIGREAKLKPRIREVEAMATAVVRQLPRRGLCQLLIDVSELAVTDSKSGIQRVVRGILGQFLKSPPAGFRVEPVRCSAQNQWVYARDFSRNFVGIKTQSSHAEPSVEAGSGDIFLALDLNYRFDHPDITEEFAQWSARGVFMTGIVYDLLPLLNPQWFRNGTMENYGKWLRSVLDMHAVIAISETVSLEIEEWIGITRTELSSHKQEPVLGYFHLGADVEEISTAETTSGEGLMCASPILGPSFLMVGTIEPRKGHDQVLGAFEYLWESGSQVRLVIVGKRGWKVESVMTRITKHPELGKRLIWLTGVSDVELLGIYASCQVLLAASFGEGFGLPLIEGASHGLPIIARDIPVFREVAGEHAFYFSAEHPKALAEELIRWLEMFERGTAPVSKGMKWLTWEQSANNLWFEIVRCQQSAKGVFDEA
jgi:glycosyltransferase involved in cell wall biosynthesis